MAPSVAHGSTLHCKLERGFQYAQHSESMRADATALTVPLPRPAAIAKQPFRAAASAIVVIPSPRLAK